MITLGIWSNVYIAVQYFIQMNAYGVRNTWMIPESRHTIFQFAPSVEAMNWKNGKNRKRMTDRPYYELATTIVQMAFSDYVDSQIVINTGGQPFDKKKHRQRIFKRIITYGKTRYCYKTRDGRIFTRTERTNLSDLRLIKDLLSNESRIRVAKAEKRRIIAWIYSDQFDIFMPNTNKEWVIKELNKRAMLRQRLNKAMPSLYD